MHSTLAHLILLNLQFNYSFLCKMWQGFRGEYTRDSTFDLIKPRKLVATYVQNWKSTVVKMHINFRMRMSNFERIFIECSQFEICTDIWPLQLEQKEFVFYLDIKLASNFCARKHFVKKTIFQEQYSRTKPKRKRVYRTHSIENIFSDWKTIFVKKNLVLRSSPSQQSKSCK